MCGIVGYIGHKPAAPLVLKGVSRLDYRGYDSCGLTVANGILKTYKAKGKIAGLRQSVDRLKLSATLAIGHTRWATHGAPSEKNAHPHLNGKGDIAVVHNGIIENHAALRAFLEAKGAKFLSETDTEVLPHLIGHLYEGNLENAVAAALKQVEGTYGIAVVSARERKLVTARKGSPILLGIVKKGEYIVASDATAITEHTRKVVYLSDGDVAVMTAQGYKIFDLEKHAVDRRVEEISWTIQAIEKKNFDHFMLKEIHEQPECLTNALRGRYDVKNKTTKFGGINIPPLDLKNLDRVIFIACGTSWHAGLVGEYYLEKYAGVKVEVEYASEFLCKRDTLSRRDLVIPISQSGESADTLMALRKAKAAGALSLGLVNVVGSTIAREVDGGIYIHVGPEIGVASTKAYTGHLIHMYLFATYLGRLRGVLPAARADAMIRKVKTVPGLVAKVLENAAQIVNIARKFKNARNFIYLGRGINFPTALEGALKLKEISYIHAEGFPAAEMKHGPIALVDKNMPVVFIVKKGDGHEKIASNIEEIKARKGVVIAIIEEDDDLVRRMADHVITVPRTTTYLSPILFIVPLQLLAYHIARLRGCEIDKPRNLAKSVTVE